MPIDSNIILGIRPPQVQVNDPLETYTRGMQLKSLLGQQELQGIQTQQARQSLADDEAYRAASMESGGDLTKLRNLLYSKGAGKQALAVEQAILKSESERAVTDKNKAETLASEAKQARDALAGVSDQPSYQNFLGLAKQRGWQLANTAPQQFDPAWQKQHLFTADEFINKNTPKYEKVDIGGQIKMVDTNPVTNPGIATTSFKKLIGPEAALHARVTAATQDPFGNLGIRDMVEGSINGGAPAAAGAKPAGPTAGMADVHGDDFLKTLPKQQGDQIKALAEGRLQFPTGQALRTPYWQNMISAVAQYDPNFDAVNYNARSATRRAFTSGAESKSLNALNTVMGHLDELDKAGAALNNTGMPWVNAAVNAVGGQLSSDLKGRLNQFEITKHAVVDEMEKAYRGSGGSQAGIDEWKKSLNAADSYPALRKSIAQGVKLLNSKIEALGDQYDKGMGTSAGGLKLLAPHAQETFSRLIREPEAKPQAKSGTITPPMTNSKGWTLHVDAKGNKAYVSPDGKQYEEVK